VIGPTALEPNRLFILTGGTADDEKTYLRQASFRVGDLAQLSPDRIEIEGKA
jgi:hypothetical protein